MADRLVDRLTNERGSTAASVLSFDSYYHDHLSMPVEERAKVNYDHPDALDGQLLVEHLELLKDGRPVAVPIYDFTSHCRSDDLHVVEPTEVVIVEGVLLFAFPEVRDRLDFRVFRRCPEAVRFSRRAKRDVAERGRSLASIQTQLMATVKPMHDAYVEPYAEQADYVTDHGDGLKRALTEISTVVSGIIGAHPTS